jgi:hypothetical protein
MSVPTSSRSGKNVTLPVALNRRDECCVTAASWVPLALPVLFGTVERRSALAKPVAPNPKMML